MVFARILSSITSRDWKIPSVPCSRSTGRQGESWLFLPSKPPYVKSGLQPEVQPGSQSAAGLGIDHVVDWTDPESFLGSHAKRALPLYYAEDRSRFEDFPPNLLSPGSSQAPTWLQIVALRWPAFEVKDASERIETLMEVQSEDEIDALQSAAKATVSAIMAGIRAIRPGASQRSVEAVVESACWSAGAHGSSFWPWAMAGGNAIFPRPFPSLVRYDHLDRTMRSGELVRLDVGCESGHYIGDWGRTVPASGRCSAWFNPVPVPPSHSPCTSTETRVASCRSHRGTWEPDAISIH